MLDLMNEENHFTSDFVVRRRASLPSIQEPCISLVHLHLRLLVYVVNSHVHSESVFLTDVV